LHFAVEGVLLQSFPSVVAVERAAVVDFPSFVAATLNIRLLLLRALCNKGV